LETIIVVSIRRCAGAAWLARSHSGSRGDRALAFLRRCICVSKRGWTVDLGFLGDIESLMGTCVRWRKLTWSTIATLTPDPVVVNRVKAAIFLTIWDYLLWFS